MVVDKWKVLVELQQYTKEIYIRAEESDIEIKTFMQPVLEQRAALDHIIRAKAQEAGLIQENDGYADKQFDKARGHLYRAFFDAADWFSVVLREKICGTFSPFDNECIAQTAPDYYPKIRPRLEKIGKEIANLRDNKDVSSDDSKVIQQVAAYSQIIFELANDYEKMLHLLPAMQEIKKKKTKTNRKQMWTAAIVGGVISIISTIFVMLLGQKLNIPQ